MQAIPLSAAGLKKRKFLLILPFLVIPFVVLLFFLLGGGQGNRINERIKPGLLNPQLPDAHFTKKKEADKWGLYELVSQDSAKWKEALKNDPYRTGETGPLDSLSFGHSQALRDILDKTTPGFPQKDLEGKVNPSLSKTRPQIRENEIRDKLSRLQAILQSKPTEPSQEFTNPTKRNPGREKLSGLLKEWNPRNPADPELAQLDHMLDKLMAIQHPETSKDSMRQISDNKESVFRVEATGGENVVSATVPEKQTLVSGATVRLQLSEPVIIAGMTIPSDLFLYGTATLSNERLKIQVRSIRAGNHIFPVCMDIYDLDGMEGIYVPGSMSRDVSRQSLDQGMSGLGLTTLDPSIGAQAASAGIQAAKTLISRKVRLVQVTIPNDYQVLLKNAY